MDKEKAFTKVTAPFTDEQVASLKLFQQSGFHPFTCCSTDNEGNHCERNKQPNSGALIPTNEGWVCPCGKYTQDWAHHFMTDYTPTL